MEVYIDSCRPVVVIGFVSCLPAHTDNIEICVNYILYLTLQGMYVDPVYIKHITDVLMDASLRKYANYK